MLVGEAATIGLSDVEAGNLMFSCLKKEMDRDFGQILALRVN